MQNPIFGVGLGGYPCYLMDAFLQGDSSFLYLGGRSWILDSLNPVKSFEAMNVFTELLASLGIVGLCAFGTLLYGLFAQVRSVRVPEKRMAYSLLVSMLVTLIVLQFNQGIFRTYIWVHLALIYAYLEKTTSPATVFGNEPAAIHYPP